MNNDTFEMVSIIVVDQLATFDICSWWADSVLAEMTQEEHERSGELMHELCLELRPILARMQQKIDLAENTATRDTDAELTLK